LNRETIVPLSLAGEASVHVVFRKPATSDAVAIKKVAPGVVATLDGPWTIAFQSGWGASATAEFSKLAPLNEHADPGIRFFSGMATYSKIFVTPRGWKVGQLLWLDLGDVHELAEVSLNDKAVGGVWHAPFRVEIGASTRRGHNRLSIKVANLWANRLIGDAQPGATRITFTSMATYRADAQLRPSGSIGPVTLLTTVAPSER